MNSNKDKKILLIFPPEWYFIGPHIALPSLSAQLKKEGYNSEVLDLNIKFFNDILNEKYLKNSIDKIKKLYEEMPLSEDFETNIVIKEKYLKIKKNFESTNIDKLLKSIDNAVRIIKSPELFKNIKHAFLAMSIINKTIDIIKLEYTQNTKSLNYIDLKEAILNSKNNIYHNYFSKMLSNIKEKNADCIGISISSKEQAIAGLTLAYLLKKHTTTHINIGGSFFSHNLETLKNFPEIFELFADSISLGEGEHSIIELAKFINGELELEDVSNIAYVKNNNIFINKKQTNIQLSELAIPDYSNINFSDYISPYRILPLSMSRGCYWNKCSFCVLGYEKNYSEKPIDKLIEELKFYKEKYSVSYFNVIDNSISPKYLNNLCDEIIKNKLEVYFDISIRLEKEFNKKLLKKMFKAGFIRIFWGLESVNQETLNNMKKGIEVKNIKKILKYSSDAGIWNITYFITGFPTETFKESLKTVDFIFKNKKIISEYCWTPFILSKNSVCSQNPQKYQILKIEEIGDFSSSLKYDSINKQQNNKFIKIMNEKNTKHCINYDAYEILAHYMHFYIKIYGKNYLNKKKNKIISLRKH